MNSAALGTSVFLHRSPSGAQRKIRQRLGGEWPLQKNSSPASSSSISSAHNSSVITEHVEPYVSDTSASSYGHRQGALGYRSLVDSSDYTSVLSDDFSPRIIVNTESYDEMSNAMSASFDYGRHASFSSHSALTFGGGNPNGSTSSTLSTSSSGSSPKPTPMPRTHDFALHSTPISHPLGSVAAAAAAMRQRHNSGNSVLVTPTVSPSVRFVETSPPTRPRDFGSDANIGMPLTPQTPVLQSPAKPMIHVHPLPVPRAKPAPPPVPEKPKRLQATRLKSFDLGDQSTASISDFDVNQTCGMDGQALNELENQRIELLATLYEKVGGRWEDLKNLHNEKKKNAELFAQTMEIAQHNGIATAPFIRFVKRFESVYEVQTRLVLNRQQLQKELKRTKDEEFLVPLMENNESNTRDVENLVDELDTTFRRLDSQLCEVLSSEEHERWVFFVRTLYSLIAEQTSIQFKVRLVNEQIKKLEAHSFKQLAPTLSNPSSNANSNNTSKDENLC